MFLTHDSVKDGILSDDHPTIVARRVMREEVAKALRARAKEVRRG
jgi:hypothetical protein